MLIGRGFDKSKKYGKSSRLLIEEGKTCGGINYIICT
tara:strand:- start:378 stop:488 length:111 start_codon:yes stop_codon:yes gene_type:complete